MGREANEGNGKKEFCQMDVYCNCMLDLIRGLLLSDTSRVDWKRRARQPRGVKVIGRKVVMARRGTYNGRKRS